jgi:hypothetical protein
VLKYREDRGVGSERLCTLTGMSRSHYLGVLDVENVRCPPYTTEIAAQTAFIESAYLLLARPASLGPQED